MDDLINRKAAIEAFDRIPLSRIKGLGLELLISVSDAKGLLEGMKAVDAIPVKHGKWFDAMVGEMPVQVCDQCNTFFPLAYTGGGHHYCPNCGAKMDLEG